jgi:hypothetical protein
MKLPAAIKGAAAALALCAGGSLAVSAAPASWKFRVDGTCRAEPRPWLHAVEPLLLLGQDLTGAHPLKADVSPEIRACRNRRGYWGDPNSVRIMLTRWPTADERARFGGW